MKKYNLLVLMPFKEEHKLKIDFKKFNAVYKNKNEASVQDFENADIIIGNPSSKQLKDAKNLKFLQLGSAGADEYIKDNILPENCILANATGTYGLAISEHLIGITLMLMKKFNLYLRNQIKHLWKEEGEIKSIYNSTFLIVGLGDIGGEFAKKIKALGGYTIGIKRNVDKKPDYLDELYSIDKLEELLPKADVVSLSLPSNASTYKLFKKEQFLKMKKSAILINVGRGTVLDTDDLCEAVKNKTIAGASIDVCDPEPIDSNHQIWDIENIIVTPHISGGFYLEETFNRCVNIALENLNLFYENKEINNIVDFSTGYRKYK